MLDAKAAAVTLMTFEILQSLSATLNLWDIKFDCKSVEDEVGWKKWLIPANAQRWP